jgi:hypothetical protein
LHAIPYINDLTKIERSSIRLLINNTFHHPSAAYLIQQNLVRNPISFYDGQIFEIDYKLLSLVKGQNQLPNLPASLGTGQIGDEVRKNLCIFWYDQKSLQLVFSSEGVRVSDYTFHRLYFKNSVITSMEIQNSNGNETLKISGENAQIDLFCTLHARLNLDNYFERIDSLALNAVVHAITRYPNGREGQTRTTIVNTPISYLYTDAHNVDLANIEGCLIIAHPQPKEAIFNLKSVRLTFDRRVISRFIQIETVINSTSRLKSFFRFYLKAKPAEVKDIWSKIDLALPKNVQFAEATIKCMYDNSSLLISNEAYNRYLYYLNSRSNSLRRFFYWFNGAYYNWSVPLFFLCTALLGMLLLLKACGQSAAELFS